MNLGDVAITVVLGLEGSKADRTGATCAKTVEFAAVVVLEASGTPLFLEVVEKLLGPVDSEAAAMAVDRLDLGAGG